MVGPGSTSCIDCVWPGDTDRSGVVDLGDLENIGRFIGEKGERRAEGDRWMGQNGNPWMSFEDSNLHHYDADGDGLISEQDRSEEHTSELQSRGQIVCRLLPETT